MVWCLGTLHGVGVVGPLLLILCDILGGPPGLVVSVMKSCSAFHDMVLGLNVISVAPSEVLEERTMAILHSLPLAAEEIN